MQESNPCKHTTINHAQKQSSGKKNIKHIHNQLFMYLKVKSRMDAETLISNGLKKILRLVMHQSRKRGLMWLWIFRSKMWLKSNEHVTFYH